MTAEQQTDSYEPPFKLRRVHADRDFDSFDIVDTEGRPMLHVPNDPKRIIAAEALIEFANRSVESVIELGDSSVS